MCLMIKHKIEAGFPSAFWKATHALTGAELHPVTANSIFVLLGDKTVNPTTELDAGALSRQAAAQRELQK